MRLALRSISFPRIFHVPDPLAFGTSCCSVVFELVLAAAARLLVKASCLWTRHRPFIRFRHGPLPRIGLAYYGVNEEGLFIQQSS